MQATRTTAPAVLFVLAAGVAGCAFTTESIPGLRVAEGETYAQTADRIQRQLQALQRRMAEEAPPVQSPPAGAAQGRMAALQIIDRYVSLMAERLQTRTGLDPYDFQDRRKPLFLYPRITCPLIAEASRPSGEAPSGEPVWILPVLLNRSVFRLKARPSWVLGSVLSLVIPDPRSDLPEEPKDLLAAIQRDFHFVLIPREVRTYYEIPLDEPPAGAIDLPSLEIPVPTGSREEGDDIVFRFPHSGKQNLDITFKVPAALIEERWAGMSGEGKREIHGELFDLRMFPRVAVDAPDRPGAWGDFLRELRRGSWLMAHRALSSWSREVVKAGESGGRPAVPAEDCEAIAAAIVRLRTRYPYFAPELKALEGPLWALADRASSEEPGHKELLAAVQDLEMAVGAFLAADPCPAPIFLDEPAPARKSFSFIMSADLQYDTDGSTLQQFLAMIDPARVPKSTSEDMQFGLIPEDLRRDVLDAKFIIIDGDVGDGKGFSSTPSALLHDSLGLTDARSPYSSGPPIPTRGEFPELRAQFHKSSKPIFAVPGNHDGFATFGGVLNQLTAVTGAILEVVPLLSLIGTPLKESVAPSLPTLVRFWRIAPPFYDGLVDWILELGPHNVSFNYRGIAFVGLNSTDLHQLERDQVGAIGNNWGGGVRDEMVVWFDTALRHFAHLDRKARGLDAPKAAPDSIVFMHHDPRGAVAAKRGYVETEFGHYNDVTTPMNELTLGYLGFSWATYSGLFIPVVSPFFVGVIREGSFGENFQERWMRRNAWDESCYNGKEIIDVINRNLSGAPPIRSEGSGGGTYPGAGISHVFFGHDDTPVVAPWIHPNGRSVFPEQSSGEGWATFKNNFQGVFSRAQSKCAPSWAGEMRFYDDRQATVVRLDDLGDSFSKVNSHGFALVTVRFPEDDAMVETSAPLGPPRPRIDVRWIPIPR